MEPTLLKTSGLMGVGLGRRISKLLGGSGLWLRLLRCAPQAIGSRLLRGVSSGEPTRRDVLTVEAQDLIVSMLGREELRYASCCVFTGWPNGGSSPTPFGVPVSGVA